MGRNARYLDLSPEEVRRRAKASLKRRRQREQQQERAARYKNKGIGAGYVAAMTCLCILTVLCSMYYLHIRAEVITQRETIERMENNLEKLRAENDAMETNMQPLSINEIKDIAINKLGLHYATEDQIKHYDMSNISYVRQYQDVE